MLTFTRWHLDRHLFERRMLEENFHTFSHERYHSDAKQCSRQVIGHVSRKATVHHGIVKRSTMHGNVEQAADSQSDHDRPAHVSEYSTNRGGRAVLIHSGNPEFVEGKRSAAFLMPSKSA